MAGQTRDAAIRVPMRGLRKAVELIRKFSDPPLETCPKCGVSGKVRKLVSSPAFQFKGSGWYVTDYAKKGGDSAAGAGKATAEGDKSGATATKPETAAKDKGKESAASAADKPAPAAATGTTSNSKDN